MAVCIDASAVIPFLLPLPSTDQVDAFWGSRLANERLVAPALLFAEVTSVVRRYVHLGEVSHEEAVSGLTRLLRLPVATVHAPSVYLRALELAKRLGHMRAYDVQYLAVAEMERCAVATLDRGMYQNALRLGLQALLIA